MPRSSSSPSLPILSRMRFTGLVELRCPGRVRGPMTARGCNGRAFGRGGMRNMGLRLSRRAAVQLCFSLFACACVLSVALARGASDLPPLIDRELFFGDPEIAGGELSPDGTFISFLKPLNGVRNVWVKRTDEPFDKARPITDDTKRPISGYFWSRDSKYVLYIQDQAGDENFNVYAVDPRAAPPAGALVATARNLTDVKGVRAAIYALPKKDPDTIYIGLNDRDKAWHDLYSMRISTGKRTLVHKNDARIAS